MPKAQDLAAFFSAAAAYIADPWFQDGEINYKLRFQGYLRPALLTRSDSAAPLLRLLEEALHQPVQNTIDWRDRAQFLEWIRARPSEAHTAIRHLWGKRPLSERVLRFQEALVRGGVSRSGAQLSITSTLLMAVSAKDYPPIRTQKFRAAFALAGYPSFKPGQDAAQRYQHALRFLDLLIERAREHGVSLAHRLEAQGVVWCVVGGWDWEPRIGPSAIPDDAEAARTVEKEARGRTLSATEKEALVLARRGQGTFRGDLLALWGGCAVTGCNVGPVLRASHLKPWRQSSNKERLDPFNGLLLAAHLDAALDNGLITFTDDGRIVFSSNLDKRGRQSLGLTRGMKLRTLDKRTQRYLRFHRKHVFQG